MKPSELFNTSDRERIEAAVRDAESGTSGEIVVSVTRACDAYAAAPWRLGATLAALALLAAGALEWHSSAYTPLPVRGLPVWGLLALQIAALALARLLCRLEVIRRLLVSEAEVEARAQRQALRAFAEHGVRKTTERTGILIFVALFEHRVVVLGDEAVNASLHPDESWQGIVDLVLEGIRAGEPTQGIVDAVASCGRILSHTLPAAPGDRDQIPHALVLED